MNDILDAIEAELQPPLPADATRIDKIRRLSDVLPPGGNVLDKRLLIPQSREELDALQEAATRSILHWVADTGIVNKGEGRVYSPLGNGQWASMPYTRTMAEDIKTHRICTLHETAMLQPFPDDVREAWGIRGPYFGPSPFIARVLRQWVEERDPELSDQIGKSDPWRLMLGRKDTLRQELYRYRPAPHFETDRPQARAFERFLSACGISPTPSTVRYALKRLRGRKADHAGAPSRGLLVTSILVAYPYRARFDPGAGCYAEVVQCLSFTGGWIAADERRKAETVVTAHKDCLVMGTNFAAVLKAAKQWIDNPDEAASIAQALTYYQGDQISLRPDNFKDVQGGGRKPPFFDAWIDDAYNRSASGELTAAEIDSLADRAAQLSLKNPDLFPNIEYATRAAARNYWRERITGYLRTNGRPFERKK
jgi:hypothetical protein